MRLLPPTDTPTSSLRHFLFFHFAYVHTFHPFRHFQIAAVGQGVTFGSFDKIQDLDSIDGGSTAILSERDMPPPKEDVCIGLLFVVVVVFSLATWFANERKASNEAPASVVVVVVVVAAALGAAVALFV